MGLARETPRPWESNSQEKDAAVGTDARTADRRRGFAHGAATLLGVAVLVLGGPARSQEGREFSFPSLNRLYPDRQVAIAPVAWGPFRIALSTPGADLRLSAHRVRLAPLGDGTHAVWAEATFSGAGTLVADLEVAGAATRRSDRVLLPRQTRAARGRVRITRAAREYRVVPLELPTELRVDVRSQLARELVAWCDGLPGLAWLGVDCGGLDRALSSVAVPLPPPGSAYAIPYAELTPAERGELDRYLDETAPP